MFGQEVVQFVKVALECSFYIAPTDTGLTIDELVEAGHQLGFQKGEISDATRAAAGPRYMGNPRLRPLENPLWSQFHFPEEPDYRNPKAFDFVSTELRELVKSLGAANARVDRSVVVERGVQAGLPRVDIEAAISIMLFSGHLAQKEGALRFTPGREHYPLASEQLAQNSERHRRRADTTRKKIHAAVRDVISRRSDGRPPSAEPLDAFGAELAALGLGPFALWWTQAVAELRQLDVASTPVSVAVSAAALVEGALTFVVRHARTSGLGVFASRDFDGDPRTWKIDDLVASAARGGSSAILNAGLKQRADALIRVRQRIHAGRMLSEFPGGVPDLRPEEARDASGTADLVARAVLDWLQKFPATKQTGDAPSKL